MRLFPGQWRHAPLYRGPAWPPGSGPDFVNSVSVLFRPLPPDLLLRALHRIEARAGRRRKVRWGPRTLDLDLIAVGSRIAPDRQTLADWMALPAQQQARQTPSELLLPHPRLQDRAFVLRPLCDLLPLWRHPLTGDRAQAMLAALPAEARADLRPLPAPPRRKR